MSVEREDGEELIEREAFLRQFPEPITETKQGGNGDVWTDARSIREEFGIPSFDGEALEWGVAEDLLTYTWDGAPEFYEGGTDVLATGKPGTGKSTLANHLALRAIEVNDSKVVWRGSSSRSEWLPLHRWVTLCLPADVDISAKFVPKVPTEDSVEVSVDDLDGGIVREVVRYRDPVDLNQRVLEPGRIHVVYPDPRMRRIEEIYQEADEKVYDVPANRERLFSEEDPSNHFWFGWVLARVEEGPFDWTTLILDEVGDIAPESARKDQFGTYQKVELLRDSWVDARKTGLSIYLFGHSEEDIHNMIRRKIRWRIAMNQSANPTSAADVVGFRSVEMDHDVTSKMDVGEGLVYTENNFDEFYWEDYPSPVSHKLKIKTEGLA